jgi:protease-4
MPCANIALDTVNITTFTIDPSPAIETSGIKIISNYVFVFTRVFSRCLIERLISHDYEESLQKNDFNLELKSDAPPFSSGFYIKLKQIPEEFAMQLNRIIALVLVVVCFVSATFGIQRRQMDEAINFKKVLDRDRLELVSIDGVITGARASASGAMAVRDRLRELIEEDSVKGVLLSINSPGGTVGASKELYAAVKDLSEKKPVVVSMLDQATSGGYYTASSATKIYANAGTLTGSIGVILSGFNAKELLNKVGIQSQTIKTGPYKDIFSSFRDLSDAERQLLQDLLQNTYQEFITDVAQGRKLDLEVVRKLADGRIYTGRQAKENKLVDVIGTLDEAVADLRTLARKKFNLPETKELPIRKSPASFERLLDQLLNQAGVSIALPFFDVVGNGKISGAITDQLTAKLAGQNMQMGNYDPPVLLMPSWFN